MSRIHIESQTHNLCEGHGCWSSTSNQCKSHKKNLCNNCTALFHYQWDLKIRNAERFIKAAAKIIDKQMEEIEKKGMEYGLDREYVEYGDWVRDVKEKVEEFKSRMRDEENKEEREEGWVRDWRKVLRDVLESQAYDRLNRTN